jgi:hypothetical protein
MFEPFPSLTIVKTASSVPIGANQRPISIRIFKTRYQPSRALESMRQASKSFAAIWTMAAGDATTMTFWKRRSSISATASLLAKAMRSNKFGSKLNPLFEKNAGCGLCRGHRCVGLEHFARLETTTLIKFQRCERTNPRLQANHTQFFCRRLGYQSRHDRIGSASPARLKPHIHAFDLGKIGKGRNPAATHSLSR